MMHITPHFSHLIRHLDALGHLSYVGMYFAILLSGHAVPVPESVTLVLLGYLTSLGKFSILKVLVVGILSTFTFDLVVYLIARGGSELAEYLSKKVKPELLERYAHAEERHLFILILISHFVPGWRFANPIILGITQVSSRKSLLYSFLSACIYAPIFILIGYFLLGHV